MKTNLVVFTGDSITAEGSHVPAGDDYPALCAAAFPAIAANKHNIAIPSTSIDNGGQGATADGLYDGTKQVNICCVLFGANDMYSGAGNLTGAQFETNLKTFCQARQAKGFKVIVLTTLPTTNDPGTFNPRRNAANVLTRADTSFYDALVDIGLTSTAMGADAAASDGTKYSDGIHPTIAGQALLEPAVTVALRLFIEESSPSPSVSPSSSLSPSSSQSPSASASASASQSPSASASPSASPSQSPSSSASPSPSIGNSSSPSASASRSMSPSASASPSASPSSSASSSPSPSIAPPPRATPDVVVIC